LNITGDAEAASDLKITQVGSDLRVQALSGNFTVGGVAQTDFTFSGVTSLNLRLAEGDDSVQLAGNINLKNVTIDLGDGNNVLDVGAGLTSTGKVVITGGTGVDQVSLEATVAKSVTINLNDGSDELNLLGTQFSSTANINTGAGADVVTIDEASGGADALFSNNLSINTGEDADTVSISNTTTSKKLTINTGDDDDVVTLNTVVANGSLSINTSAGDDDLNLLSVQANAKGTATLSLGTGADDVVISQTSFNANLNLDLGTGIVNTLKIDDSEFFGSVNLTARGSIDSLTGVGDVINIETDTTLLGSTIFHKAVKMKVGAAANVNLGVLDAASHTDFQSSLAIAGINPAADLEVAAANNIFFSAPSLSKVIRTDLV
jgi:hypothetical protein